MWKWNSATRYHLCPEDGEWFYSCTSQWVRTSGQACCGPGVWDGRVPAAVVHDRVERSKRRGDMNAGVGITWLAFCVLNQNILRCHKLSAFFSLSAHALVGKAYRWGRCGVWHQTRNTASIAIPTPNLNRSKSATQYPAVHKLQVCVCWCDSAFMCISALLPTSISLLLLLITDENCRDRRHNCVMVVQARLCVYHYYKTACCASCAQSAQRSKRHWPAKLKQPRSARMMSEGLNTPQMMSR